MEHKKGIYVLSINSVCFPQNTAKFGLPGLVLLHFAVKFCTLDLLTFTTLYLIIPGILFLRNDLKMDKVPYACIDAPAHTLFQLHFM